MADLLIQINRWILARNWDVKSKHALIGIMSLYLLNREKIDPTSLRESDRPLLLETAVRFFDVLFVEIMLNEIVRCVQTLKNKKELTKCALDSPHREEVIPFLIKRRFMLFDGPVYDMRIIRDVHTYGIPCKDPACRDWIAEVVKKDNELTELRTAVKSLQVTTPAPN